MKPVTASVSHKPGQTREYQNVSLLEKRTTVPNTPGRRLRSQFLKHPLAHPGLVPTRPTRGLLPRSHRCPGARHRVWEEGCDEFLGLGQEKASSVSGRGGVGPPNWESPHSWSQHLWSPGGRGQQPILWAPCTPTAASAPSEVPAATLPWSQSLSLFLPPSALLSSFCPVILSFAL